MHSHPRSISDLALQDLPGREIQTDRHRAANHFRKRTFPLGFSPSRSGKHRTDQRAPHSLNGEAMEDPEDNPEYQMFMEQTAPLATPAPAVPKTAPAKPQKQEEERAPKKGVQFPWKPILAVVAVICVIVAFVFSCIYFESARHWIIAITIGVAYAVLWNLVRWKFGLSLYYLVPYIVTSVGFGIACIASYWGSDTSRTYAFGFEIPLYLLGLCKMRAIS